MRIFRSTSDIPNFNNAVITIGAFDGVHFGHRKILERVKSLAKEIDGESVVITFEPHPRKILFPNENDFPMLQTLEEKLKVLSSLNIDNVVVLPFSVEFSQMHPREYIENLIVRYFKPKYVVIGYDHRFGLNRSGDIYFLKQYEKTHGFKVIEISKQEIEDKIISSTTIRNALLEGDVQSANSLLQNNYLITGQVVKGDGIGKTLGYPTANLKVNGKDKLIPADGVYAVLVNILDEQYEGMLYIGSRPTLKGSTRNIEVNIFNFNQDIYGYEISVELLEFLRGDMKFENLEELKTQIKKDKEKTLQYFEERKGQNPIKNIDCTVAILNYNGLDFLESYLPSISDSSVNQFDIVVIDNGSTDDSVEFVKEWYPEIKILELSRNYGFAGGYTKALKSIQTKYTALVNSDVRVEP
ncbi:MAG TPA: bifunctional riboflavin kinase/FAD synthetase, partial [Saprospiraceae bacterium]|nr:bifunctional riboflavin kinase/FAD synthetase [Saprospiraceae bacterium]